MWRLVLELKLSILELDRWDVVDVLDANEALDVWDDAQDPDLVPPGQDEGMIRFVVTGGPNQ